MNECVGIVSLWVLISQEVVLFLMELLPERQSLKVDISILVKNVVVSFLFKAVDYLWTGCPIENKKVSKKSNHAGMIQ